MFDMKEYKKQWRKKKREHIRAYHHNYAINHPEKILYLSAQNRAKKRQTECTITEQDITIPKNCPCFNKPLEKKFKAGKRGASPYAPSLDRIDNKKGYIKGNVQVISYKANTMKGNATPEELLQFAFWIILTYGHLIDKDIS